MRIPVTKTPPSETNIKVNLVKYLSYLDVNKSILKSTPDPKSTQRDAHSHDSNCVLFHSVSDVDCPPDEDLNSLCQQEIPINWTFPVESHCIPYSRKTSSKVSFHNTVDVQDFKSHQAPIQIRRFLPLTPQIYPVSYTHLTLPTKA